MKLNKFLNLIFKPIYFVVSFFITIGDVVRYILTFILKLIFNGLKSIILIVHRLTVLVVNYISNRFKDILILLGNIRKRINHFKAAYFTPLSKTKLQAKAIYRKEIKKESIWLKILTSISLPNIRFPKILIRIPILEKIKNIFFSIGEKLKYVAIGSFVTLLIVFFIESFNFVKSLPSPELIGKINYSLSTHIYDRNGKLLYEIFRNQNRTPISLKDIPQYVVQATIAIEDKDFFRHNGISLGSGIVRAIKDMITKGGLQGGSTITQQLVKSALLTPERTIQRKVKEIILAIWTENIYSKDQILEMYLNQVPYGGSAYGIEEASKVFFGKEAKNITLDEAALLAGLPQAPSVYSPYSNPDYAKKRRNDVLSAMKEQGYITEEIEQKAINMATEVIPPKTSIKAPHFVFYAKSQLENEFGISQVEEGGLKVTTTLDLDIQEEAEKILREELEKVQNLNITNGAILVTKPTTGEILAMVGSVDYFTAPSGAFNVTTALRQPGSSIKPIMYSLALQKGYTAASIIDDSPVAFTISGSEVYRPVNYDSQFHGKIPLRYALANSYNIPAVKTLNSIGVSNFIDYATKMGISTWNDKSRYGLSLTLGGGEVTMIDMAKAFGTLANKGNKVPISYYLKIENNIGGILQEINSFKIKELDEGVSYIISDILSDNFARQWAFGARTALEIPGYKVAVKTGTTNDKKDNWTIGYTPDFLVAVWVGNNNNQPMNPYLASGITGAAPIWSRTMSYLLKKYSSQNSWYSLPENVIEKTCYFGKKEYFIKGTEKSVSCSSVLFGGSPTPTPTKTP